jgi:hypothetical protein
MNTEILKFLPLIATAVCVTLIPFVITQMGRSAKIWSSFATKHGYHSFGLENITAKSTFLNVGSSRSFSGEVGQFEPPIGRDNEISFYHITVNYALPALRKEDVDAQIANTTITVCECTIAHNFPTTLLLAQSHGYPSPVWKPDLKNFTTLTLEGNFSNYFAVHVEKDRVADALEFLTPDVMEELIARGADFHMELYSGKFFIYSHHVERSMEKLEAMNSLAEYVVSAIKRNDPLSRSV